MKPVLRDEELCYLRRCLSPVLPGRGVDWVLNTLPPGSDTGEFTAHRHGVEEYIYVRSGRLGVRIGDKSVTLEAGIRFIS